MKTPFLTKLTASLAFTIGLALVRPADAQVLIDFGTTPTTTSSPGNPGYYWNNVSTGATVSLVDITNAASGLSVGASGFGGFSASGGVATPPGGMTGTAATEFGGLQQDAATDYIFGTSTNTGTLTFSGLTAGVVYEFTIFSARNTTGNFLTDFSLNGGVAPSTGQVNAQFNTSAVVVLSAQAVGTTMTLTAKNNNPVTGGNFYINAVEIVAVPEPASVTMAGAGVVVALGLVRRRQRLNC